MWTEIKNLWNYAFIYSSILVCYKFSLLLYFVFENIKKIVLYKSYCPFLKLLSFKHYYFVCLSIKLLAMFDYYCDDLLF